jgi:hypothetical protein
MRFTVLVLALASALTSAADIAVTVPQAATGSKPQTAFNGAEAITIPQMLSYQGRLTDSLGVPVADTLYAIRFMLYAQLTGGSPFWQEDQQVRTEQGLFSVLLGSVTPIGSVPDAGAAYLGMTVAGGSELVPRLRIASAAYTYLSARSANADLLQGRDTATFSRSTHNHDAAYVNEGQADAVTGAMVVNGTVQTVDIGDTAVTMAKLAQAGAATGQVVKWTGSAWAPGQDNAGGGSGVTDVYQDTGIICVPNPITSSGNVKLDLSYGDGRYVNEAQSNSVTSAMIADGNVTSADIRDTTITTAKLKDDAVTSAKVLDGSVTSVDIRDTTVNTADIKDAAITMAKLNQAGATTGQVIKWSGSAWAPRNDSLGVSDNAWVRVGSDSVLYTIHRLGIARGEANNMLYGTFRQSHVNFGVSCTTGVSGQNYSNLTIGGGLGNSVGAAYSTVAGGLTNRAIGIGAVVAGGAGNVAGDSAIDTCAVVAGGYGNLAAGMFAVVGGGKYDSASSNFSTVGGGYANTARGNTSTVGGGVGNEASGTYATVGGGDNNTASEYISTVGGGFSNEAGGQYSTVGGGHDNEASGSNSTVGGGGTNGATALSATVGGGSGNTAAGLRSTVAGGSDNIAGDAADDTAATVAGGYGNAATHMFATVGGGQNDTASHAQATVSGGGSNLASGDGATVAGGWNNTASGIEAMVGGGQNNTATATCAVVGGGSGNSATGFYSMVPGGYYCQARGYTSLAAGRYARAGHGGTFAWSDSAASSDSVYTTGDNQWRVRARGGVWFYSNLAKTTGAYLAPNSNSWESACDSMTKEDFRPVDRKALLEKVATLRVRDYKMKDQDDGTRHVGPVAQDFNSAFGYGGTETGINLADADGIALAAIQALYEDNRQLRQELEALKAELAQQKR